MPKSTRTKRWSRRTSSSGIPVLKFRGKCRQFKLPDLSTFKQVRLIVPKNILKQYEEDLASSFYDEILNHTLRSYNLKSLDDAIDISYEEYDKIDGEVDEEYHSHSIRGIHTTLNDLGFTRYKSKTVKRDDGSEVVVINVHK